MSYSLKKTAICGAHDFDFLSWLNRKRKRFVVTSVCFLFLLNITIYLQLAFQTILKMYSNFVTEDGTFSLLSFFYQKISMANFSCLFFPFVTTNDFFSSGIDML